MAPKKTKAGIRPAAAQAGYSGTPLPKKLGIKSNARVALVSAPSGFERLLGTISGAAIISRRLRTNVDVLVFFPSNRRDLERRLPPLVSRLNPSGGLWVAWPKKASGVPTDLDFAIVQRAGLSCRLVDNKVCAMDDVFSGLRFVVRLIDRPKRARSSK